MSFFYIPASAKGLLRVVESTTRFSLGVGKTLVRLLTEKNDPKVIPEELRKVLEDLGATYIKMGQFIASAPSLFPDEFVHEMQLCLDRVRPVSFDEVRNTVEKELGKSIEDAFQSFDPQPIASASIAQVHGAVTKEGLNVVVKVQRPDIETTLTTDLNLLYLLSLVMEKFIPGWERVGISSLVEEFQRTILQEIDFYQEARNIEEFDDYLFKVNETRARVPRVYHNLSTKKILTMERFYGYPITDVEGLKNVTNNPRKVLTDALEIWFSSLATNGFFHADVHAGNLMILKDGQIGFIDFGIVGRISTKVWSGLMLFLEGLQMGDGRLTARGLIEMDSTGTQVSETELSRGLEGIFREMQNIIDGFQGGKVDDLDEKRLNRLMFDMRDISRNFGLKIPREFGLLIKQILYFDRYVKSLAPDINIMRDQRKFIQSP
jgi:predicted unusual protein kinase regulating ubiquinone biosynthesis (AarF/ABC1/UbiB family)